MKFIIKKKFFLKTIQKLNNIICINTEHPITNNILCCIKDNITYLMSTNLELEIISKIHCSKVFSFGEILIPGKKILNIIRSFPQNAEINITINNNSMELQYQNIYFSLNIINAKNFPRFKRKEIIHNLTVNQKKFKNMIYNTHYAMAKQDIRHYLNGMNIKIKNNKILAIATDGYRMAFAYTKYNHAKTNISIIIPYKTILKLIQILEDTDDLFQIHIGKKIIQFNLGTDIISSKIIDQQYPNCKNFFIKKFDKIISIDKDKLKQALIRASILIHQKLQGVRITMKNGLCIVTSNNENDEKIKEKFQINYFDIPIEITINIKYILDVIRTIQNSTIDILLTNNSSAIYIKCTNINNSYHIIMPLVL
ncbi:DNA polymerase III subunit beta [Buchnera aphidicola]|uniref:Beta sliding clamp n=1 Tax=Buchnera aphidicola (Sarucallis kahawaluokalani) TaxID=1241878 RepID=A0A4D6YCA6_9GAMM|nr:DNA polymerase III subunit beta [Buchnera aphidicola]QCI25823.1 DNA polymerase III subunit beta [Buchnera aphidicola (Sarucallis kahawaluokalani)]